MQREADHEAEIEATSRANSAHRLRPSALHRLCYAHRQKEVEMEALRDYLHRHEDPATGRPLFKPLITRGPKDAGSAGASTVDPNTPAAAAAADQSYDTSAAGASAAGGGASTTG